jgi:sugar (pentulose or hexulose) kinase
VVQIVTLTSTLADTGEDRVTTVSLSDVVDQLLNEDGLADTSTTEETNLSTTSVRSEQIDDLDTSDQNLGRGGLVSERRGISVDRQELVGLDRSSLVNGVTSDVQDTTESGRADRDGNGSTSVGSLGTTNKTLSTVHGNATNDILTQVLSDLEDQLLVVVGGLKSVQDRRQLGSVELDVDDGTTDLVDLAISNALGAGEPDEGGSGEGWSDSSSSGN